MGPARLPGRCKHPEGRAAGWTQAGQLLMGYPGPPREPTPGTHQSPGSLGRPPRRQASPGPSSRQARQAFPLRQATQGGGARCPLPLWL